MAAMLGIVLVSYNTSPLTIECLRSIAASGDAGPVRVEVIDNSTDPLQRDALAEAVAGIGCLSVRLTAMDRNIGFAAACNRGIDTLLGDPAVDRVLLLNNDAVLVGHALSALLAFAERTPHADMVSARMHRIDYPERIDSLGIALYASALASNRKRADERLLGPTGGLALYTRRLLETLRERHGHVFDERFFCYTEDTDVALRALLLGFEPAFLDRCVALHWGQASSGGGFSDFVLYHGIRNSVWTMAKNLPSGMLLTLSPLMLALHLGIMLRHTLGGRGRVVWRLYRDALTGLPAMMKSRRTVQASRTRSTRALWAYINPRFYDRYYLRDSLRDMLPGRRTGIDHG